MGIETCPQCSGAPEHAILCGTNGCRETTCMCDLCGGFGIVTVEAAGRELRHKRVHERGLTQE
jgi:hypothetical protein